MRWLCLLIMLRVEALRKHPAAHLAPVALYSVVLQSFETVELEGALLEHVEARTGLGVAVCLWWTYCCVHALRLSPGELGISV